MRAENIELTMKIPMPVNRPDANGTMITEEALINAINNVSNIPFVVEQSNNELMPVGVVQEAEYIKDSNGNYIFVSVNIFAGGTCQDVFDIQNDCITKMELIGIGIAKK